MTADDRGRGLVIISLCHTDWQIGQVPSCLVWQVLGSSSSRTLGSLESRQQLRYITGIAGRGHDHLMKGKYTPRQGEYLAFIYYYTKIHGCAPSEADMERYFRVSWSSVHQMILTMEERGLIMRTPGEARSIRVLLLREELPDLK